MPCDLKEGSMKERGSQARLTVNYNPVRALLSDAKKELKEVKARRAELLGIIRSMEALKRKKRPSECFEQGRARFIKNKT
jgi:hypothetical protein